MYSVLLCSSWHQLAAHHWWTPWRSYIIQSQPVTRCTPSSRVSPRRSAKGWRIRNLQVSLTCSGVHMICIFRKMIMILIFESWDIWFRYKLAISELIKEKQKGSNVSMQWNDIIETMVKVKDCSSCVFSSDLQLYHSETLELMLQRWSKLERDFRMKNGRYDISKIPDIYDCIKYDSQHNASVGLEDTLELFRLSRALADIVIPQVKGEQWHLALKHILQFCMSSELFCNISILNLLQWLPAKKENLGV